jgi:polar amino acid transport system substrate-binding protein
MVSLLRALAVLLIGLRCWSGGSVTAADVIVVDEANPPFMYAAADGRALGIYPALLTEASSRMANKLEVTASPWRRALLDLDRGQSGVAGLYKNSDRLRKYDYSDKLFDEQLVVYATADNRFPFTGLDSLQGRMVGILRGWSYGDEFDAAVAAKSFTTEEVNGDAQNFEKLAQHRLDAVVAIRQSADSVNASAGNSRRFIALDPPLMSRPTFVAFAKSAGKTAILAELNTALAAMRKDGSFDKIVSSTIAR